MSVADGAIHGQADRHAMTFGQQAAFDPRLWPRSVGLGPVFYPPSGAFVIAPSMTGKPPVDALQFVEPLDARLPELGKTPAADPCLKAIMGGRMGHQFGLIEGLPLTAGAQDRRWHPHRADPTARATAAKTVGVHMDWQKGLQTSHRASEIRKPVVVLLFSVRARTRLVMCSVLMPVILPPRPVIRIGSKSRRTQGDPVFFVPLVSSCLGGEFNPPRSLSR